MYKTNNRKNDDDEDEAAKAVFIWESAGLEKILNQNQMIFK